jgi:lipopolysaccharide transport system ATP-binding protein
MLLGLRRAEVAARLASIVDFAGLAGAIDDPISTWSDGMRARLGFSVAYHADPDLLLLDEALGTGDAEFHEKSAAAMRERIRSDRTCVLVSHDPAAIAELCDRCLWIERGEVAASGSPADVLATYNEARHAQFEAIDGNAASFEASFVPRATRQAAPSVNRSTRAAPHR